jgi:hypothetical protein
MTPRLVELTPDNVAAACRIDVKAEQRKFVAPVVESIAEAYVHYGTAWPRLILDDDRIVGFVMGNFDPDSEIEAFRAGIWRLNIAADQQSRGYGNLLSRPSPRRHAAAVTNGSPSCGCRAMAAPRASTSASASHPPERYSAARSSAS